ncbi:ANK repeat-containing protein nipk-1 [Trichostrongylus colubriformis]|uniref:ANK repeat-containing protein nipk-1 n=1 Tax=Trichostrongylus colubriformis TaxID=6319 RepID=A0AAN8IG82_TRICO
MSSENNKGACLVARAIPLILASSTAQDVSDKMEKLSINDSTIQRRIDKVANNISPSDFVTLQSIRSSALARKTATTSKFCSGGASLFDDLLNKDHKDISNGKEDVDPEEKNKEEKPCSDSEHKGKDEIEKITDGELLSRGPVRNVRAARGRPPYSIGQIKYGTAMQSTVNDYSSFSFCGNGYEFGNTWVDSPDTLGYFSSSSSPDSVGLDQGYRSSSPLQKSPPENLFADHNLTKYELSRLLDSSELPDPLVDFILKYSRRYTEEKTPMEPNMSPKHRPPSADSGLGSPMSARSASHASPEIPTGGNSGPATPALTQTRLSPSKGPDRTAKQNLRALIPDNEMDDAWAWTLKCIQFAPGTLTHEDDDRDTLLHIVVSHHDLAKIYSLVEQQLKLENVKELRSFDVPNRHNETPLFLAVQQQLKEVVAYLLEVGADPNVQSVRLEREGALHYAAARGMLDIVKILCGDPKLRINELNGRGQTALHCAIISHGVIDEQSQKVIDSSNIIVTLLKAGADPTIVDARSGRTVVHYAIETMDPHIVEVLKDNVEEDAWTALVNLADFNHERPMDMFKAGRFLSQHESTRSEIFMTLLISGARIQTLQ